MANIQVTTGGSRKPLDTQVLLVPFIDLLLCCVMFLLVTAVWNDLSAIRVQQQLPGAIDLSEEPSMHLVLSVRASGYELSSAAGERHQIRAGDVSALRASLREWHGYNGTEALTVAPEDGVPYDTLIDAMDTARGAGFTALRIGSAN